MRARWLVLYSGSALLLQLVWPHGTTIWGVVPNFFLVLLVALSPYIDARQLLWVAFGGGLVLDIVGGQQFGFQMAFFILLALLVKIVLRIEERTVHVMTLVLIVLIATVLYDLLFNIGLGGIWLGQWQAVAARIATEMVYNGLLVGIIGSAVQLRSRGIISS